MPGFDGTGPGGYGPGTGGGRGYCYPEASQGYQQGWGCRGRRGQRRSRGGQRRGRGQPGWAPLPQEFYPPPAGYNPYYEEMTLEEEKEFLGNQMKNLEGKINELRMRLDEIGQQQAKEKTKGAEKYKEEVKE